MGASSGSNTPHQSSSKMLPPRQQPRLGSLQTSLSLVSSDSRQSPDGQEPRSNSDNIRDSPTESASSHEAWPTADAAKKMENGKVETDLPEQSVIRRVSTADKKIEDVKNLIQNTQVRELVILVNYKTQIDNKDEARKIRSLLQEFKKRGEVGSESPGIVGHKISKVVVKVLNGTFSGDNSLDKESKHGEHSGTSILKFLTFNSANASGSSASPRGLKEPPG